MMQRFEWMLDGSTVNASLDVFHDVSAKCGSNVDHLPPTIAAMGVTGL